MSPNLDSPVQIHMTIAAALNRSFSRHYYREIKSDGRPPWWKRILVQTADTGWVFSIELDRGDNAHTVKRRLQLALNFPTEGSSLTFGDRVLKNDLSTIRNDSPLLLTRNSLHRSSSSPCLSPTGMDLQQGDQSGLIEILGYSGRCSETKQLVKDAVKAIKGGVDPIPVQNGLGGAYYLRNIKGESVAIVKPTDEEPFGPNNPKGFIGKALGQPGLKGSVRVGETGFREVAAYLLDYGGFASVPPTVLVKITHSVFHVNKGVDCKNNNNNNNNNNKACNRKPRAVSKIASFQRFVPHDFDASDHGTSSFSVSAVHRIGILDVRIFNTDRHAGNLLVRKLETGTSKFGAQMELIPIDHGLCLPESLEDPYFEWIHWPQASIPFSEDELEYIAKLDPIKDSEMLRMELPMIREACLRVLVLSTIFLKEAAAFGLSLAEIGQMMSREFAGMDEEPSELEVVCIKARRFATERQVFPSEADSGDDDDVIQFDIECEDNPVMSKSLPSCHVGFKRGSSGSSLSKLDESVEDEEEDDDNEYNNIEDATCFKPINKWLPTASKLSTSLKEVSLVEKRNRYLCGFPKGKDINKTNNRSANEKLPVSAIFVTLADMTEEEWGAFLEKFQELLPGAFHAQKHWTAGQRPMQRLGTSCQF